MAMVVFSGDGREAIPKKGAVNPRVTGVTEKPFASALRVVVN
jgi:hypothetical protein